MIFTEKKRPIIIDCDPGHDDAVALMMAFAHPEQLDVLAVSTVGGNHDVDKITRNAQNLLDLFGTDVPLIKGSARPLLVDLETGDFAHGDSGMNGHDFKANKYPVIENTPFMHLYNIIKASEDPVSVVALGPLTNIALLIQTFPDLKDHIESILIMGGGIDKGNVTAFAEFNIYVDPHAASVVFNSGIPVVMAGLNVSEDSYLTVEEFSQWNGKGDIHQVFYNLLHFYNESGRQFGFEHSAIHDAVPMAYLLDSSIFSGHEYPVTVILDGPARGATLADKRMQPDVVNKVFVIETVDRQAFRDLIDVSLDKLERQ